MEQWAEVIAIFMRFRHRPELAWCHDTHRRDYATLSQRAMDLAVQIRQHQTDTDRHVKPVLVYGHKSFDFIAAWWACLLCGCPVVPVESDNSPERVEKIALTLGAGLLLNTTATPVQVNAVRVLNTAEINGPVCTDATLHALLSESRQRLQDVPGEPLAYIMFSSGTTGEPKGIQITLRNMVNFIHWIREDFPLDGAVTGNVRYCFDVSLFEIWLAWVFLQPLSVLDHRELISTRKMIAQHAETGVVCWVSTPSIIRLYLLDPTFSAAQLPLLRRFIFCGETLTKDIVTQLWKRFPDASVINTYGPTECTVAVTSVLITPEMISDPLPLPIGAARPGAVLSLHGQESDSGRGELLISGPCVGPGYLNAPLKQQTQFIRHAGQNAYLTGDIGQAKGDCYYFLGREDGEVKIQGHRIDLYEIEHFLRSQNLVSDVVAVPFLRKGNAEAIQACVILNDSCTLSALGHAMQAHFPPWSIPRYWYAIPHTILNHNGKLDRSAARDLALDKGEKYVFIANQTAV